MNSYDPNENIAEKINTFKALVENFDDEIALKYLEKSGWDETVLKNFIFIIFSKHKKRKQHKYILTIKASRLHEIYIRMKCVRRKIIKE